MAIATQALALFHVQVLNHVLQSEKDPFAVALSQLLATHPFAGVELTVHVEFKPLHIS